MPATDISFKYLEKTQQKGGRAKDMADIKKEEAKSERQKVVQTGGREGGRKHLGMTWKISSDFKSSRSVAVARPEQTTRFGVLVVRSSD
jgi:hypothetical protein